MSSLIGQIIKGTRASYRILQPLKGDTVFKAHVLESRDIDEKWWGTVLPRSVSRNVSNNPVYRAVLKMAKDELKHRGVLRREYRRYQHPRIAASPFIRKMYESIGDIEDIHGPMPEVPPCLVLEWMDADLRIVPQKYRNGDLPRQIAKSVFGALQVFRGMNMVHTG